MHYIAKGIPRCRGVCQPWENYVAEPDRRPIMLLSRNRPDGKKSDNGRTDDSHCALSFRLTLA